MNKLIQAHVYYEMNKRIVPGVGPVRELHSPVREWDNPIMK
jgi:hypothetical protein